MAVAERPLDHVSQSYQQWDENRRIEVMYVAPGLAHKNLLAHIHALCSCSDGWCWVPGWLEARVEGGRVIRWKKLGPESPFGEELPSDS